jgi:uncharacterized repeat protein (TIGR03803 family)
MTSEAVMPCSGSCVEQAGRSLIIAHAKQRNLISGMRLRTMGAALAFAVLFGALATGAAQAQTFSVLYAFRLPKNGEGPAGDLALDAAGAVYGTTVLGGNRPYFHYAGVVFKVDSHGHEAVLHRFSGLDGQNSYGGVVRDAAGNLYGTTIAGGKTSKVCPQGCGTVFKLNTSRKETVLHSFNTAGGGRWPSNVIRDSDGNFYGTTSAGGKISKACPQGCGTVFKLDKKGRFTVLYSFAGGTDAAFPWAGLCRDAAGNLYGTTVDHQGTVFKLDATGKETVLYRFSGGTDGGGPLAGLIQDAAGNLYGTTVGGGDPTYSHGVVFKVDTKGNETVLHAFAGSADGYFSQAALIQDAAGNLFGTTSEGGTNNGGTVFKIDANGVESVLHSFDPSNDGAGPSARLIQDASGNLYGTASSGGKSNHGTVFKLTP